MATHSVTTNKSRKSILRGSPKYVSQVVTIPMGEDIYRFDIREVNAETQCLINGWADEVEQELDMPAGTLRNEAELAAWMSENGFNDAPLQSGDIENEGANETISQYFARRLEDLWDVTLVAGLVSWDLQEPMTPENIRQLPKVFKRKLYKVIEAGSSLGAGAESFFL